MIYLQPTYYHNMRTEDMQLSKSGWRACYKKNTSLICLASQILHLVCPYYFGAAYSRCKSWRQLGKVNLGQVNLGQVNLGQVNSG